MVCAGVDDAAVVLTAQCGGIREFGDSRWWQGGKAQPTPAREKALDPVTDQGLAHLVALQGFEPRTCGL